MPKESRPFGIAPLGERRAGLDLLSITGVVDLHLRSLPEPKRAFLGLLGWNSYGTEGAQPVANVRHAERRKMA